MILLEKFSQNQNLMISKLIIFHLLNLEDYNFVKKMIVFIKKELKIKNKIFQKWKWQLIKVNLVLFQDNQVEVVIIFIIYFKRKLIMLRILNL